MRRGRDIDIIDGRFDDVTQPVDFKKFVLDSRPDTGGFERELGAGIEHASIDFIRRGAIASRFAVITKAPSDSRRDIEPAEECLRQEKLMKRVGALDLDLAQPLEDQP